MAAARVPPAEGLHATGSRAVGPRSLFAEVSAAQLWGAEPPVLRLEGSRSDGFPVPDDLTIRCGGARPTVWQRVHEVNAR